MEHLEFLSFTHKLTRQMKRVRWRDMMARRSSAIARALKVCEVALGPRYVEREKVGAAWVLRVEAERELVDAIRVQWTHLQSFQESPSPLDVVVLRPDIVDTAILHRALLQPPKGGER